MHNDFAGVLIKLRQDFRIIKNSHVIDSGHGYQLEKKLKENGLFKEVV